MYVLLKAILLNVFFLIWVTVSAINNIMNEFDSALSCHSLVVMADPKAEPFLLVAHMLQKGTFCVVLA